MEDSWIRWVVVVNQRGMPSLKIMPELSNIRNEFRLQNSTGGIGYCAKKIFVTSKPTADIFETHNSKTIVRGNWNFLILEGEWKIKLKKLVEHSERNFIIISSKNDGTVVEDESKIQIQWRSNSSIFYVPSSSSSDIEPYLK